MDMTSAAVPGNQDAVLIDKVVPASSADSKAASVIPWNVFIGRFPRLPSPALASSLQVYNVYCNLSTCGNWPLVSIHFDAQLAVYYLACWTALPKADSSEVACADIVVPVSISAPLSPARLRQLCTIVGPGRPSRTIGVLPRGNMVRVTFVDGDGIMVFARVHDHLSAPAPLAKETDS